MEKQFKVIDIANPEPYSSKIDIFFFSDEWETRNQQCRNFLNAANSIWKEKIHARKCVIKEIDAKEGKTFLDDEHIQGSSHLSLVFFGLFHNNDLISVMSLGRHSRQTKKNLVVLDRFCVKSGVQVNGGGSRLFKKCVFWAIQKNYEAIITFSDNRLTDGNFYGKLGFKLHKINKKDYCYVDSKNPVKRISKQSQKKRCY